MLSRWVVYLRLNSRRGYWPRNSKHRKDCRGRFKCPSALLSVSCQSCLCVALEMFIVRLISSVAQLEMIPKRRRHRGIHSELNRRLHAQIHIGTYSRDFPPSAGNWFPSRLCSVVYTSPLSLFFIARHSRSFFGDQYFS